MARQPRRLAGIGATDLPDLAAVDAYVGPPREVISDGRTLRVHDGTTVGGVALAAKNDVAAKAASGANADITSLTALKSLALSTGDAPLDTSLATTKNPNAVMVGVGNAISVAPMLSTVLSPSSDHQRTSLLVSTSTNDDGHSEEQTLCVLTSIKTGYAKVWAVNTAYSVGDNVGFSDARNSVYRCVTAGTSAASGTGPTGKVSGIVDGTAVWDWVNDQAINAKVGIYNEVTVLPGAGSSWGQANNVQLQPGTQTRFAVNTEFDFTNNSGTDASIGGNNYYGLWMSMNGSNKSTSAVYISANNNPATYSAFWGLRLSGDKLASDSVIAVDSSSKIGLAFGVSGIGGATQSVAAIQDASTGPRSIYITGAHTSSSIDDPSNSPTSLNVGGTKTTADINLTATAPVGIRVRGTKSSAGIDEASTTPAGLNVTGTKTLAGIRDASTAPTGVLLQGTYATNQISGTGWSVSPTGTITSTVRVVAPEFRAAGTASPTFGNVTNGVSLSVLDAGAATVNYLTVRGGAAGAGPNLKPDGSDTNIHLNLYPKGTNSVFLRSGDGTAKVQANDTGLGFNGATPVAKPAVSGSRGGNAAVASLITALATLGLITDSTTA